MDSEEKKIRCQYTTTYRKDFIKRKLKEYPNLKVEQEFKDPMGHAFETYLEIDKKELKPPVEDVDVYVERVKDDRKKIGKKYFEQPLDHKVITWDKILNGKSVYQVEYCDVEGDMLRKMAKLEKLAHRLPDGWVFPLTTQKYDFRDPSSLTECGLDRPSPIKPVDNIVPDEKLNEIMKLRKIDSEYNTVIGKLGRFIVENEMHGKIDKVE
ncbi:uncharacterized protein LOC111691608 [Anoplophora glabripennis]|uniref:uncharacterized protein LOC111691608 n=1 Tax=Anoplophora glabripennis TaxID=217634 RepID=UPI000C792960|nr:uncharacterized protein LOC111691608 [Anoplophora glabripennis]